MDEKTLMRIVVISLLFLSFIHVKVGEYFDRRLANTNYYRFSNKRLDGWFICLIPAFIIVTVFARNDAPVLAPLYVFISMAWGVIYFDYIKKDERKD